jgi:hypothetical protein
MSHALGAQPRAVLSRFLLSAALTVAATGLLVGCSSATPASSTAGASARSSATTPAGQTPQTPSADASTPATATPTTPAVAPLAIPCTSMLTATQLYAFNPNLSPSPHFTATGSLLTVAVAEGGTACGWLYESSNDTVQFAVAAPPSARLTSLEQSAATGKPTAAYGGAGVKGYFTRAGGHGEVQVFAHGHWIVGQSTTFFEPGDAEQLVKDILGNLGLG